MNSSSGTPASKPTATEPPPAPAASPADGQQQQLDRAVVMPEPGEQITSEATGNTYTIADRIGEGHFGIVYGCTDVWNNQLAAKVLKPLAPYETVRAKAVAEMTNLLALRHPNITYLHDAFEYRDTFYLITERCFWPLSGVMSIPNFNGAIWALPVARCLLQAVHFLHQNTVVHQDIHSGNVFAALARDELNPTTPGSITFKLGDLGVAKLFGELDASNTRAEWMLPPEVLEPSEFGPIDHRLDIYHVGLLLLAILRGREESFSKENILAGKPRELALELPAPFSFALEKTLRRHVTYRTETAMELWRDLHTEALGAVPSGNEGTAGDSRLDAEGA